MKTYHIKDLLKNDLLLVELPDEREIIPHDNGIIVIKDSVVQWEIKGFYTLLGKPDEIREEDAKGLVEKDPWVWSFESYRDYTKKPKKYNTLITATESLLSAIETQIFWENPLGESEPSEPECECEECYEDFEIKHNDFMIAESRTFDRSRTLIFVKQ